MKFVERLGENVLRYLPIWLIGFAVAYFAIDHVTTAKSVTLDAKHWECTLAVPNGIETRCTEYHYKGR